MSLHGADRSLDKSARRSASALSSVASGQITMRKVDGWESLAEKPSDQLIDLAA